MSKRRTITQSPLGAWVSWGSCILYVVGIQSWPEIGYWLFSGIAIVHVILLYKLASLFQQTRAGEWLRGAIIGLNAGLNGLAIYALTGLLSISILISFILWLSSFLFISRNKYYHTLLGWINWILPMSWAVVLPGFLICMVNLIMAPLGYMHPLLKGIRIKVYFDVSTCTLTMYGGLIRPIRGFSGLNMGNFIFINPGWEHLLKHEIGHLFSLAAMGSVFHYVGGIDECYLQSNYWEAYAEYLAESYSSPSPSVLSMWK